MAMMGGMRRAGWMLRRAPLGLAALFPLVASCRDVGGPAARPPSEPTAPAPPAPPAASASDAMIFLATADGTVTGPLTRGHAPAWAPDGRRIAFYRSDGAVYVVDVDGSGERRLAEGHWPAWSPDGRRIVFTNRDGISVMNADGSGVTTLVRREFAPSWDVATAVGEPSWSPDGRRIAFLHYDVDHGSSLGVFVVNVDGSDVRSVATAAPRSGGPGKPSWSPDGSRLAFADWDGQVGITVRDVRGGAPDVRYRDPAGVGYVDSPAWAPDGRSLAFTVPVLSRGMPSGRGDVWTMPVAGGGARMLIRDGAHPAWSPDGTRIAFVSTGNQ
jgi:Tol biopolymer transport system component